MQLCCSEIYIYVYIYSIIHRKTVQYFLPTALIISLSYSRLNLVQKKKKKSQSRITLNCEEVSTSTSLPPGGVKVNC